MEFRTSTPVAGILPPPSLPEQSAPDCTGPQGRSVCQVSPVQAASVLLPAHRPVPQLPAGVPDLADPQLPINFFASTYRPPDSLVPKPRLSPTLKNDIWTSHRFQQPRYLPWIERQLELRRQTEQENGEYCFKPLLTCLENMQIFIGHIQAGKQFNAPLTPDESRVLADLSIKTTLLVQAGVPYKRTVRLALALTTLCELITTRQVFRALSEQEPGLFREEWIRNRPIRITPDEVTSLFWSEGPPGPLSAHQKNLACELGFAVEILLEDMINDNNLFVFPSFQALNLPDFCRFSHLPVHPVGLTTDYALNADGYMMSPLRFAEHDIIHMHSLRHAGLRHSLATTFYHPDLRLALRQLLLDRLPGPLAALQLAPALELLLFELFHERSPCSATQHLENSAKENFRFFLTEMAKARRQDRSNYSEDYQQITDARMAMASLWAVRLWQCGQTLGMPLTPDQLTACLETFLATDLPLLQEHLGFFERHRALLRQLFFTRFGDCLDDNDEWMVYVDDPAFKGLEVRKLFQTELRGYGLSHLDNTDLFYFEATEQPEIRHIMQQKTGAPVPPALVLTPPSVPALEWSALSQDSIPPH